MQFSEIKKLMLIISIKKQITTQEINIDFF